MPKGLSVEVLKGYLLSTGIAHQADAGKYAKILYQHGFVTGPLLHTLDEAILVQLGITRHPDVLAILDFAQSYGSPRCLVDEGLKALANTGATMTMAPSLGLKVTRSVDETTIAPSLLSQAELTHHAPSLLLQDVKCIQQLKAIHAQGIFAVAWSPNNEHIACGFADGTIQMFGGPDKGYCLNRTWQDHSDLVVSLSFTLDSSLLASGSYDKTIRVFRVKDGHQVACCLEGHSRWVYSVCFSPRDGGRFIVSGSDDETVRVWDRGLGTAFKWKQVPCQVLKPHTSAVFAVAFNASQTWLVTGALSSVHMYNVSSSHKWKHQQTFSHGAMSLAFSPRGALAMALVFNKVQIFEQSPGGVWTLVTALEGHSDLMHAVAFSPDGLWLASGSADSAVRLYAVDEGFSDVTTQSMKGEGHSGPVRSIAFSPDCTKFSSASVDATLRVWEMLEG